MIPKEVENMFDLCFVRQPTQSHAVLSCAWCYDMLWQQRQLRYRWYQRRWRIIRFWVQRTVQHLRATLSIKTQQVNESFTAKHIKTRENIRIISWQTTRKTFLLVYGGRNIMFFFCSHQVAPQLGNFHCNIYVIKQTSCWYNYLLHFSNRRSKQFDIPWSDAFSMFRQRFRRIWLIRKQNERITSSPTIRFLYKKYPFGAIKYGTRIFTRCEEIQLKAYIILVIIHHI